MLRELPERLVELRLRMLETMLHFLADVRARLRRVVGGLVAPVDDLLLTAQKPIRHLVRVGREDYTTARDRIPRCHLDSSSVACAPSRRATPRARKSVPGCSSPASGSAGSGLSAQSS